MAQDIKIEIGIVLFRACDMPLKVVLLSFSLARDFDYKSVIELTRRHIYQVQQQLWKKTSDHRQENCRNLRVKELKLVDLLSLLKWCMFCLNMMDKAALPVLLFITDGVNFSTECDEYDGILMQLCRGDIPINFINILKEEETSYMGYATNPAYLLLLSKFTGGNVYSISNLESTVLQILERETYLFNEMRDWNHDCNTHKKLRQKNLLDEYLLTADIKNLIQCRIKEGFKISKITQNSIKFKMEPTYIIAFIYDLKKKADGTVFVSLYVKCLKLVFNMIKEKKALQGIMYRESKNSHAGKVFSIWKGIKDTDKVLSFFESMFKHRHASSPDLIDNIKNLRVSKWQRWLRVERIDIVLDSNSKTTLTHLKKQIIEILKDLSELESENLFMSFRHYGIILMKNMWEGKNKSSLYLGFYKTSHEDVMKIYSELLEKLGTIKDLYVFQKQIGKLLIENIYSKKSVISRDNIYHMKPQRNAVKFYMTSLQHMYDFHSSEAAESFVKILIHIALEKKFIRLRETEENIVLMIQAVNMNEKSILTQYSLQLVENKVNIGLYIEPIYTSNPESFYYFQNLHSSLFQTNEFLYHSLATFYYLVYKSLIRKLNDDDLQDNEHDNIESLKIDELDDVYTYLVDPTFQQDIKIENISDIYEELKLHIYNKLHSTLEYYENSHKYSPNLSSLLKLAHRRCIFLPVYLFPNSTLNDLETQALHDLYKEVSKGFGSISDYSTTIEETSFYTRYINDELLLIWELPSYDKFVENMNVKDSSICISYSICDKNQISIQYIIHLPDSNITHPTALANISLIQKIYINSFYRSAYFSLLENRISVDHVRFDEMLKNFDEMQAVIDASNVYRLISEEFIDPYQFTRAIFNKIYRVRDSGFAEMDKKFDYVLNANFVELASTGYYMKKGDQGMSLLKLGNGNKHLSQCLFIPKIDITICIYQTKCHFNQEITHLIQSLSLVNSNEVLPSLIKDDSKLLQNLSKHIESLLAEKTLEILSTQSFPDIDKSIYQVLENLPKIRTHVDFCYEFELILRDHDYIHLIQEEFERARVISVRVVDEYFFYVSRKGECCFMSNRDIEQEDNRKEADNYESLENGMIPFWIIFEIIPRNSVRTMFYLPDSLAHEELSPTLIKKELIRWFKLIEIRVNQRILLKQLVDTGNISSLLFKPDNTASDKAQQSQSIVTPSSNSRKPRRNKTLLNKDRKESDVQSAGIYQPGYFKMEKKYEKEFQISDRLGQTEALNSLKNKFSVAPFVIYNREGLFMLINDDEVYVFRFSEVVDVNYLPRPSNINSRSLWGSSSGLKSSVKSSRTPEVSFESTPIQVPSIRLEVYGIDEPSAETKKKLEQTVYEVLQQSSLLKLADALVKNQKMIMTLNDREFIQGNNTPILIVYPLPNLILDVKSFFFYMKQNLLRFLDSFKIKELMDDKDDRSPGIRSSILVYNYLRVLDVNQQSGQTSPFHRWRENKSALYLGNPFGKGLALVYLDISYFNGEESYPIAELSNADLASVYPYYNELCTQFNIQRCKEEIRRQKVSAMEFPTSPGLYLEIKLYKNGPLNDGAFKDHLGICVNQNVYESMLEFLVKMWPFEKMTLPDSLQLFYENASQLIRKAIESRSDPLSHGITYHYIPDFYTDLLKGIMEILNLHTTSYIFIVCENSSIIYHTSDFSSLQSYLSSISSSYRSLQHKYTFKLIAGAELLEPSLKHDPQKSFSELKHYDTYETFDEIYIRSLLILIEISVTSIEVLTYNLNKAYHTKLNDTIDHYLTYYKERCRLLNHCLTQKLGIHHNHSSNLSLSRSNTSQTDDLAFKLMARGCYEYETKKNPPVFKVETLLPDIANEERACLDDALLSYNFKMLGMYSMIKYHKIFGNIKYDDPIKKHLTYMHRMVRIKHKLLKKCVNLAYVYKKWNKGKSGLMAGLLNKTLSKAPFVGRHDVQLAQEFIKHSIVYYRDKAVIQITPFNRISHIHDPPKETNKMRKLLASILSSYAEKLTKNFSKLEMFTCDQSYQNRKVSYDMEPDTNHTMKKGWSTGGMIGGIGLVSSYIQIFLQKIMDQSMILIEMLYEDEYITVTIYCIEDLLKLFPTHQKQDFNPGVPLRKELERMKSNIKTQGYVYDIQIKHLVLCMIKAKDYPSIDVVQSLDKIHHYFHKTPLGAASWIFRGMVVIDLGDLKNKTIQEIYNYFTLNCDEYGFELNDTDKSKPIVYNIQNMGSENEVEEIQRRLKATGPVSIPRRRYTDSRRLSSPE